MAQIVETYLPTRNEAVAGHRVLITHVVVHRARTVHDGHRLAGAG